MRRFGQAAASAEEEERKIKASDSRILTERPKKCLFNRTMEEESGDHNNLAMNEEVEQLDYEAEDDGGQHQQGQPPPQEQETGQLDASKVSFVRIDPVIKNPDKRNSLL